jgi:hypothetical protein
MHRGRRDLFLSAFFSTGGYCRLFFRAVKPRLFTGRMSRTYDPEKHNKAADNIVYNNNVPYSFARASSFTVSP